MRRFEGRVVFITGSGSGIGRAIALRFSGEGAKIISTDIDQKNAQSTADEITSHNGIAVAMHLDVTKSSNVKEVVETAWNEFGKIDFLINNAGVSTKNRITDLTEEEWDFVVDVNAKGVFLVTSEVLRKMLVHDYGDERPKIVNVASKAGKDPGLYLSHYAASKHAVIGLTKAIAKELATERIYVNCVCPGLVQTPMQEREILWEAKLRKMTPEEIRQDYLSRVPLGRLETPDDVAKVVVFLCSHDSDYMTGQSLNVDGGMLML